MGIDGLHQFLKDKKVTERIKLSSLANQTVAIDGHCWYVSFSDFIIRTTVV